MNNLFHVAAASGGEVFIGLVVAVIAIIVQIIKSRAEQAPKPQGSSPGSEDPGDELRKFLESLGGEAEDTPKRAAQPPIPVAPPPPPPARRPVLPQAAAARPRQPYPELQRPSAEPSPQRAPLFVTTQADPHMPLTALLKKSAEAERSAVSLGHEIGDEVDSRQRDAERAAARKAFRMRLLAELRGQDPRPIQKAIVLSELLGAPVGLRQASQAPGAVRY